MILLILPSECALVPFGFMADEVVNVTMDVSTTEV